MPNGGHHINHGHDHGFFRLKRVPRYLQIIILFLLLVNYFALNQTFSPENFALILGFIFLQVIHNIRHWF